jgi:hypothetical protein
VTWTSAVAGPSRSDLEAALDKPLARLWRRVDQKSGQRQEARTCRDLLHTTWEPTEVSDSGAPPEPVDEIDWHAFVEQRVACRTLAAVQKARPALVDNLGAFSLDNARLKDIPAAVIPTPSPWEEKQLQTATARGASWKRWDRKAHVTLSLDDRIVVQGSDTISWLAVRGRGDFDGDGIEDLVLSRIGSGREGTWASSAAFVLTRRSPQGKVQIVKVIE